MHRKVRAFWPRQLRIRPTILLALLCGFLTFRFWVVVVISPRFQEPPPAVRDLRQLERLLRQHVEVLARKIGPRSLDDLDGLRAAETYIEQSFEDLGHAPRRHGYDVEGTRVFNIEAELIGTRRPDEIIIVGAHYDTVSGQPGANDNASGTAVLLALAAGFRDIQPDRTLRFVAFVNEEPPWFQGESMGSYVYAKRCRQRGEDIQAMWSLETLGYYTAEDDSQDYPFPLLSLFYPERGNFIAFVGNGSSQSLLRETATAFDRRARFPSEAAVLPGFVPGTGWSDHWSFWQFDYPALLITDTALFRYPHYHTIDDTSGRLDYTSLARVTDGLQAALRSLSAPRRSP